jgi:hypothetical protein
MPTRGESGVCVCVNTHIECLWNIRSFCATPRRYLCQLQAETQGRKGDERN